MKKVTLVLGLGISGVAAAEFLLKQNALVLGIDGNRALLQESGEISRLKSLGLFVQCDRDPIDWDHVESLVVSPGVSPEHPIYRGAREHRIALLGEAELALSHFQKPLVAVTGTNGKTTVTLLVEHALNSAGIKAQALGNVGTPLCRCLTEPSDAEVFVVELSSYQLETMSTPVFTAAALLNITPDHLERYANMREYAEAKCRLQHLVKSGAPFYVGEEVLQEFGALLNAPSVRPFPKNAWCGETGMSMHDSENALAAWALCQPFHVSEEQFKRALQTFKKPPHRVEFVREIDGVSFYDDSKGTNIDAVVKAVGAMKGPVILIAGGVDKGASYLLWKEHLSGKIKQIIAIGQAAPKIYDELHLYFDVKCAETLDSAVLMAATGAAKGDSVLLSPGCSSFDMFRDYAHRGKEFQHLINTLEARRRS